MKSPLAASSPRGAGGGGAGGTPTPPGGGAGGGGAGGTPTTPGPGGGTPLVVLTPQMEYEHSLVIISRVIHATHDMAPSPEGQTTPVPFMYWDSIKPDAVYSEKAVATALIKRSVVVFMSPLFFLFGAFLVSCSQKPNGTRKQQTTSLLMHLQPSDCFVQVTVLFNVLFNV